MGEEVNNIENNKKQKVAILIGVVTLLIAVLGATYAFFQMDTESDKSLVTLQGVTSNLHLNISASDMSYDNRTKEYYGTDGADLYVGTEELGTKTIASVELQGGEATTKYSCTAKLTVSKVTDPEEEADTMLEVLQPGDMILQFKGNIISEQLDLSELKENNPKEYNLKFKVTGNTPEEIQAYIKLINKDETQDPQNYLAGRKLNIDISTSELQCEVFIPDPKVAQLRAKDKEVSGGIEHISEQGGMYRYQGTDNVPNWILFGTREKCEKDEEDKCTNSKLNNMTYDEYVDKYMYRIIGITEEGEMYLLKETFLKEGTTNKFAWHNTSDISDCLGDKCEWPNVDLYKRLNGTVSNGNPIFVDNSYYEYMAQGTEWYQLIADHNWMYGDTYVSRYNGDAMYAIETGKTPTKRDWPDEEQGQETCSSSNSKCTSKPYTWSKSKNVEAKIGLMYMHDIDYAYADCSSGECIERGNPGGSTNVANSWIHFKKDGYNTSQDIEWLITRFGVESGRLGRVDARSVSDSGILDTRTALAGARGSRPVFYLSSAAEIADGDGTKDSPFILE